MLFRALVCGVAVASAYELPMSRRAILTRVAAVAPLAAVAGPAFADADNRMYTLVKRPEVEQVRVEADYKGKAIGLTNMNVDDNGSAFKPNTYFGSAGQAATMYNANKGIRAKPEVRAKGMERLMAK